MSNQKIKNDDGLEINGDNNVINITKGSSSNRLKKSKWKMVLNIGVPLATAGVGASGGYLTEYISKQNTIADIKNTQNEVRDKMEDKLQQIHSSWKDVSEILKLQNSTFSREKILDLIDKIINGRDNINSIYISLAPRFTKKQIENSIKILKIMQKYDDFEKLQKQIDALQKDIDDGNYIKE